MRTTTIDKFTRATGRMTLWRAFPFVIVVVALVTGCGETAPAPDSPPAEPKAEAVPPTPIDIMTVDALVQRVADAQGKVLVVNFWATYCIPCAKEMPDFAKLDAKYKDATDVEFLSLTMDGTDFIDDMVRPFAAEHKIPFQVYVVADHVEEFPKMSKGLQLGDWDGLLPLTLVYDREGVKRHAWPKQVHYEMLTEAIEPLRESTTEASASTG
jgi:thiol-disulfide isomerase/thioredoxin